MKLFENSKVLLVSIILFLELLIMVFLISRKNVWNYSAHSEVDLDTLFEISSYRVSNDMSFHRNHNLNSDREGERENFSIPEKAPKLRIVSPHFNRLDYLYIQYYSILTYILDEEWEYIVVDNYNDEMKEEEWKMNNIQKGDIKKVVDSFNDERVIYKYFDTSDLKKLRPSARCAKVQQFVFESCFVFEEDDEERIVMMIDSDSIFYDYINIGRFLRDQNTFISSNYRYFRNKNASPKVHEYLVHNSFIFDTSQLPQPETVGFGINSYLRFGEEFGPIECGGETTDYLFTHPEVVDQNHVIFKTCLETLEQIQNNLYFDPDLQSAVIEDYYLFFHKMRPKERWSRDDKSKKPSKEEKYQAYHTHLFEDTNLIHFKDGGNWMGLPFQKERARFWWEFFKNRFGKEGTKTPLMKEYPENGI